MPMPHGTYLRVRMHQRIRESATQARRTISRLREDELADFYRGLRRVSIAEIEQAQRDLAVQIKKRADDAADGDPPGDDPALTKALKLVEKILEPISDYKQLEGELQVPVSVIVRAPPKPVGPDYLAVAIALCQMLQYIARVWKDMSGRGTHRG